MAKQPTYVSDYISDRLSNRSRYEIDQELLERGIDAEEIDAAWHSILHPKKKTLKSVLANHKKGLVKWIGLVILLGLIIWGILSNAIAYLDPNRSLFDSVPDYPHATPITLDDDSNAFLWTMFKGDNATEYKIYLSVDSQEQIQQYYEQYADRYHYDHSGSDEWFISIKAGSSYTSLILSLRERDNIPTQLSNALDKGNVIILEKGYLGHCCG